MPCGSCNSGRAVASSSIEPRRRLVCTGIKIANGAPPYAVFYLLQNAHSVMLVKACRAKPVPVIVRFSVLLEFIHEVAIHSDETVVVAHLLPSEIPWIRWRRRCHQLITLGNVDVLG